MSKLYVTRGQLLGTFAKYAVSQSPYPRPDNLEVVLDRLNQNISDLFDGSPLGVAVFDNWQHLENYLAVNTELIPEFQAWNIPKTGEREAELYFVSLYDAPGNPDDDFIDLEALWRNVAVELERENAVIQGSDMLATDSKPINSTSNALLHQFHKPSRLGYCPECTSASTSSTKTGGKT